MTFSYNYFKEIISCFDLNGTLKKVTKIHQGTVNLTFKISILNKNCEVSYYILQMINKNVFVNPDLITNNAHTVLQSLLKFKIHNFSFIKTYKGNFILKKSSHYWRIMNYLDDTVSKSKINSKKDGFNIGQTLGEYHNCFAHLNANNFVSPIKNFHNFNATLKLFSGIKVNSYYVKKEPKYFSTFNIWESEVFKLMTSIPKNLTTQIIHGDTRIENFLLSTKKKDLVYLIDFDTIYNDKINIDIADLIRSLFNDFNNEFIIESLLKGYFSKSRAIQKIDIEYLVDFIRLLSFELSIRFMYDYLTNGNYFDIDSSLKRERAFQELNTFLSISIKKEYLRECFFNIYYDTIKL